MFLKLSVVLAMYFMRTAFAYDGSWYRSHATFYGGADASGTMGKFNTFIILLGFMH